MIYLELDDVLAIACEVLQLETDEILRVTDLGLADSAVARPRAGFGDEEFYPTIEAKAASLLFGLARNHAFIDGNKRIAVLATLSVLELQRARPGSSPCGGCLQDGDPGRLWRPAVGGTHRLDPRPSQNPWQLLR